MCRSLCGELWTPRTMGVYNRGLLKETDKEFVRDTSMNASELCYVPFSFR